MLLTILDQPALALLSRRFRLRSVTSLTGSAGGGLVQLLDETRVLAWAVLSSACSDFGLDACPCPRVLWSYAWNVDSIFNSCATYEAVGGFFRKAGLLELRISDKTNDSRQLVSHSSYSCHSSVHAFRAQP